MAVTGWPFSFHDGQIGRVYLIGVDHRALEIGDQDVFGRGADFFEGKFRVCCQ